MKMALVAKSGRSPIHRNVSEVIKPTVSCEYLTVVAVKHQTIHVEHTRGPKLQALMHASTHTQTRIHMHQSGSKCLHVLCVCMNA